MPRWLKIIIAVLLLAALSTGFDWAELPQRLADVRWSWAAGAVLVIGLELPVNAWKWLCSLRLHGLRHPWLFLFRVSCMAYFFNNFMPSAIGGDVYRVYRTWPQTEGKSRAVSAILLERIVGLMAMLVNGAVGALLLANTYELARVYLVLTAVAIALAVAGGLWLACGGMPQLRRLTAKLPKLAPIETNLLLIIAARREWLPLIATSFLFQWLAAAYVYCVFAAVGAVPGFPEALLITAAAGIASVLPISISGLGVVEGSITATAVSLGIAYEPALLAALLSRLLVTATSGTCGLLYVFDRTNPVALQPAFKSAREG